MYLTTTHSTSIIAIAILNTHLYGLATYKLNIHGNETERSCIQEMIYYINLKSRLSVCLSTLFGQFNSQPWLHESMSYLLDMIAVFWNDQVLLKVSKNFSSSTQVRNRHLC